MEIRFLCKNYPLAFIFCRSPHAVYSRRKLNFGKLFPSSVRCPWIFGLVYIILCNHLHHHRRRCVVLLYFRRCTMSYWFDSFIFHMLFCSVSHEKKHNAQDIQINKACQLFVCHCLLNSSSISGAYVHSCQIQHIYIKNKYTDIDYFSTTVSQFSVICMPFISSDEYEILLTRLENTPNSEWRCANEDFMAKTT